MFTYSIGLVTSMPALHTLLVMKCPGYSHLPSLWNFITDMKSNINLFIFFSVRFTTIVGMEVVGCVVLLLSVLVAGCFSLAVPKPGSDRQSLRWILALWVVAGVLIVGSTIWLFTSVDDSAYTGYSFYFAAIVGGSSIIGAFVLGVISSRMSPPPTPAAMVMPSAPQTMMRRNETTWYPPKAQSGNIMTNPTVYTTGKELPQMDPAYGYNQA